MTIKFGFCLGASLLGFWKVEAEVKRIAIEDFSTCTRDRFIEVQTEAKLAPSLLLTNEMGVTARIRDPLTADRWAKVVFDIPSAQVARAQLLFYVDGDLVTSKTPMCLLVNGDSLFHRTTPDQMLTGGWDRHDIPPEYLRDGRNEIVFGDRGVLYVDPGEGGHSSRSFDGGQIWQDDALGSEGKLRGEYMVRLRLQGHPPAGYLTSPVIDLADPEGLGLIAPRLEIRQVRLSAQQQTPPGTDIEFELRTGQTPGQETGRWTEWVAGTALPEPGRYVQWRARLGTQSADQTPVLERVVLEAEVEAGQLSGLQLLELDQPKIVYSKYAFTSMAPHQRVDQFLEQYDFASTMAAGGSEMEQFARLRDWVHSQWLGWQSDKYPYCPSWDPLEILHVTKNNLGFGMCTHYAAVFVGAAASLGYTAREIIVDHHCLVEIWSEERQKWILQDPGPAREYDAHYTLDGEPINGLELHRALAQGRAKEVRQHQLPQGTVSPISRGIADCFVRFGISLRNNHLVQAEPAEFEHGNQHYHWNGYLWWTDAPDPQYPEYSLQSSNPSDFYWGVNQTRLYLQAGERSGELQVEVETATPNFSHFLVQVDGGAWKEETAPLRWQLHEGENALSVRSANSFGRQGRIARARVLQSAETGVLEEGDRSVPRGFELEQNFPNPFNSSTVIHFALPEERPVELAVYDLLGRRVATLAQGKQPAGRHTGQRGGLDEAGRSLASGVYLYRLRAGVQVETRELLLLK